MNEEMNPLTFTLIKAIPSSKSTPTVSTTRLGTLVLTSSVSSTLRTIHTPNCFLYTSRGTVPHLTPDNLRSLGQGAVQISLEHLQVLYLSHLAQNFDIARVLLLRAEYLFSHIVATVSFETQPPPSTRYPNGIHKFLNFQDYIVFCDIRDPSTFTPLPANTNKYVTVRTHQGVGQVSLDSYLETIASYRPDIFASYADLISENHPKPRRIKKSVDRTLKWLDACLERLERDGNKLRATNVFAHVVGSQILRERERSARETAKRDVQGFIVNTFNLLLSRTELESTLRSSVALLPLSKPRMVYGIGKPEDVLTSVSQGLDLFTTAYPTILTEKGRALTFDFPMSTTTPPPPRWIDLRDEKYTRDFTPILQGCECMTCRNGSGFSKAYLRHLLIAGEMLGGVLVMSHNLHHYSRFFQSIRQSIQDDTFPQYSEAFIQAYNVDVELDNDVEVGVGDAIDNGEEEEEEEEEERQ